MADPVHTRSVQDLVGDYRQYLVQEPAGSTQCNISGCKNDNTHKSTTHNIFISPRVFSRICPVFPHSLFSGLVHFPSTIRKKRKRLQSGLQWRLWFFPAFFTPFLTRNVRASLTKAPQISLWYLKDSTGLSTVKKDSAFFSVRVMDKSYDEALTARDSLFGDPVDPVLIENAHAHYRTGCQDRFERFKGSRFSGSGICQCPVRLRCWTHIYSDNIDRCVSGDKQGVFPVCLQVIVQRDLEAGWTVCENSQKKEKRNGERQYVNISAIPGNCPHLRLLSPPDWIIC